MTLLVSDGKAEEGQHKIEVELKSIADGKSSKATLTYSQPAMMKKNRSARNYAAAVVISPWSSSPTR